MTYPAIALASLLAVPSLISAVSVSDGALAKGKGQSVPPAFQRLINENMARPGVNQTSSDELLPAWLRGLGPEAQCLRPARAPVIGDQLWSDEFGLPSCDGWLRCGIRFGNDLVVGGSFKEIGGVAANNIARWDGAAWHSLGAGVDREVTSLAIYQGALFVGGGFQFVDGRISLHLAKWDGTEWSPVGAYSSPYNCCYELNSLVVFRGELIAGGFYGYQEPQVVRGLAAWNGSSWRLLGEGVHGRVNSMLAVGDSLYVAGVFDSAGTVPAANIAMWDGTAWSALGSGIRAQDWNGSVQSLAYFRGRLYAAGFFDSAGGQPARGVAAWDGSAWSALPGHDTYGVTALGVFDDTLAVAEYPRILRWDGAAWVSSLPELVGWTDLLLPDETGLIVLGREIVGEGDVPLAFGIERWDGSVWHGYETWNGRMNGLATWGGIPAQVQCLASFQGDLIAGGDIRYSGAGSHWKIAAPVSRWDGSSWTPMPFSSPVSYGYPEAFLPEGDTLYAAGEFYDASRPSGMQAVVRWESNQWTSLDSLGAVGSCLTKFDGRVVLGTIHRYGSTPAPAGVYIWDGNTWNVVGAAGDQDYGVLSMTVHEGKLIIGGSFASIGGVPANGVASWDGVTWRSLSAGGSASFPGVTGVASFSGRLIAAGHFAGSGSGHPLAAWDGGAWTPVDGITGYAYYMDKVGERLLVYGDLRLGSAHEGTTLATWDGRRWQALGSGLNNMLLASAQHDGALYVGGFISMAGGKSSFGIARWNGFASPPRLTPWLSPGRPNPFLATADFSFRLELDQNVRIAVHDIHGREITYLEDGVKPAGTHVFRWDGRDRLEKQVGSGIYFVSIRDRSGAIASRKIVRLR
jgi:hypothetical protein